MAAFAAAVVPVGSTGAEAPISRISSSWARRRDSRASSRPLGRQKRSMTTIAARPHSEEMMSVSSIDRYVALIHCEIAKTAPVTRATGQTWRTPRRPSVSQQMKIGTKNAMTGVWWPT